MTSSIQFVRIVALACLIWPVQSATAQIITLSDLNSVANIDVGSQAGQFKWTIDGVNHLSQQWFWYRIGDAGAEASVDTISVPVISAPAPNFLSVTYTNPMFSARLSFLLTGGTPGSRTADIAESIRIINNSGATLPFRFFQYVNFDLNGTPGGDVAQFLSPNVVQQTKGSTTLTETVITPPATHLEAALFNQTLVKLNDGLPTTLNDNWGPLGPQDVTWAFEWDYNIAPGGTLLISKDKQITPEPSGLAVMLAAGLLWRRRR